MGTEGSTPASSPPASAPTIEELQTKVVDLQKQVDGLVGVKKSLESEKSELMTQVQSIPQLNEQLAQKGAEVDKIKEQLKLYEGVDPKINDTVKTLQDQLKVTQAELLTVKQQALAAEFGLNADDLKGFTVEQLGTLRKGLKLKGVKPSFAPSGGGGTPGLANLTPRQKISQALEAIRTK